MTLLEAVNYILPKLGEHQVTSLDSRNATLRILLQLFDMKRQEILARGWWFNQYTKELPLSLDNKIYLSPDMLAVWGVRNRSLGRLGNQLFDTSTQTDTFTAVQEVGIIIDRQFDLLPWNMQAWIKYEVLLDQYASDLGVGNEYMKFEEERRKAEQLVIAEHLRNKRYSTKDRYNARRISSAIRGRP